MSSFQGVLIRGVPAVLFIEVSLFVQIRRYNLPVRIIAKHSNIYMYVPCVPSITTFASIVGGRSEPLGPGMPPKDMAGRSLNNGDLGRPLSLRSESKQCACVLGPAPLVGAKH